MRLSGFLSLLLVAIIINQSSADCQRRAQEEIQTVEFTWQWLWNPEIENLEEWQIFDHPTHMLIGIHDDLFICDHAAGHIIRIRTDGSYIETIGREGGGPGEFRRPYFMALNNDSSTLLVTDYSLGRISLFRIEESSSEFIESHLNPSLSRLTVPSLIMEDDHSVWTIGFADNPRIRLIDLDDSTNIEFGDPWIRDNIPPMNVDLLNRGLLFDPGDGGIGHVWRTRPMVEIWSKDGNLQTEMQLSFPELSVIDDYFKDNDPSELGIEWVPVYFQWTHTLAIADALFIGFAAEYEQPFVFFELNSKTLAPRRKYSCSDTPEIYRIVSCVAEDTGDGIRFYAFDAINHGIAIFESNRIQPQ